MKSKQSKMSRSVACAILGMAGLAMSGVASASGFALIEQNASGIGNAFAGGAAIADDASTVFFNPAGMTRLEGKQVVVAAHYIKPSMKFSGTGMNSNMGGDAGSPAIVPNAYFAMEMDSGMKFGLGLNAPFGLQTEYDAAWAGQHQAIKSKIETININPSIAYRMNDDLSVGAGIDYQRISGVLSNYGGAVLGTTTVKGDDTGWGYNFGLLYNINQNSRLGMSYRSAIMYTLSGTVETSLPFADGPASLDIELPDTLSMSMFHRLADNLDVMGDISYTGWSSFKQVKVLDASGTVISNTVENWKNTWRLSVGATLHYSEQWSSRIGVAYDQSPVTDEFRTARVPDSDRTWLALGGQYKMDAASAIDFGYAHLFVKNSTINSTSPAPALTGNYKSSVDILSVQYTHNM